MRSRDRDHPGQHGETSTLLKIQKISWAWWRMPVIPATQEAEAGELPEPRRRKLWWAKIAPLYSSLGNKSETPSQKKRMVIIKKSGHNRCWRGCGEIGTLLHCWWECKLVQPLWRTVWWFLRYLEIEFHLTQQSYYWVYIKRIISHSIIKTHAHIGSLWHCLQ